MTKRKSLVAVFLIWTSAIVLYLPMMVPSIGIWPKFYEGMSTCTPNWGYSYKYSIPVLMILYVIPCVINMIPFIIIWQIIYMRKKQVSSVNSGIFFAQRDSDNNVTRMLFLMTFGFYLMWTPFFVCIPFAELFTGKTFGYTADFVSSWFGACNSIINPLLYFVNLRSYRKTFLQVMGCKSKRKVAGALSTGGTSSSSKRYKRSKSISSA